MQSSFDYIPENEENNKNRLRRLIGVMTYSLLLITIGTLYLLTDQTNNDLKNEVAKRDSIIGALIQHDSIFNARNKNYSDVITKYVNNCKFIVDGKEIPQSEFISLFNHYIDEYEKCRELAQKGISAAQEVDSVNRSIVKLTNKYADSLFVTNSMLNLIKRDYGITYKIRRDSNMVIFTKNPSTVDSALGFYPREKSKRDIVKKYLEFSSQNNNDKLKEVLEEVPLPRRKNRRKS